MPLDGRTSWFKRLLIIPPVVAGAVLLAVLASGRSGPEQASPTEIARVVRVITVQPTDFVPRALGYGYVEPGTVWEAVAQVAGKVVYRHPDLERGRVIKAETEILRIDPTDYELALAQAQASLENVAAQLAELTVKGENTQVLLEIERRALGLAKQDLERKEALLARGNASQSSVDQAENAVLTQRQRVQDLDNQLNLLPAERRVLEANQALQQTQVRAAELSLERTSIRLPISARISEVAVEEQQFVSVNQKLAVADSIDVAEVSAQVALDHVRALVKPGFDLSTLTAEDIAVAPRHWGLSATVRLVAGETVTTWDARFDRIGDTVDPQTRTIGFIVAVDEPYRKVIPGKRPPLVKNMYVEVELRAPPRAEQIVVPRSAIHAADDGGSVVYVAGDDGRLVIRAVDLAVMQGDIGVLKTGLDAGERVVVSDLVPAIEGMLLAPNEDDALAGRLRAQAAGATALR